MLIQPVFMLSKLGCLFAPQIWHYKKEQLLVSKPQTTRCLLTVDFVNDMLDHWCLTTPTMLLESPQEVIVGHSTCNTTIYPTAILAPVAHPVNHAFEREALVRDQAILEVRKSIARIMVVIAITSHVFEKAKKMQPKLISIQPFITSSPSGCEEMRASI